VFTLTTVSNLVQLSDLIRLPKDTLQSICNEIGIDDMGSSDYLAERIWNHVAEHPELQDTVLHKCNNLVFAGKTSVVWFHSTTEGIRNVEHLLIQNHHFDPFERVYIPQPYDVTTEPYLIGAVNNFPSSGQILMRFIHKTGTIKNVVGSSVQRYPRTSITTAIADESSGYLEVRAAPEVAALVAREFARLIRQQVSFEVTSVSAPFGYKIEQLADALNGELVDTVSKPEELLEDFTAEHAESVRQILIALDEYFKSDDISELEAALTDAKLKLGEDNAATPFTVLVLNGLSKVSLRAPGELRGLALYDYLRPNLQHQGGYVRFPVVEDGIVKRYTIRVGMQSNSIYFMGHATEDTIAYVRERILQLLNSQTHR
jgi:hypothetical protein